MIPELVLAQGPVGCTLNNEKNKITEICNEILLVMEVVHTNAIMLLIITHMPRASLGFSVCFPFVVPE